MKIVTWNVNSLKARHDYVEGYLDTAKPDVLCLQELKLQTDAVPRELFESRGYHLAIHGQKQWNGVLIASKSPLTDVVCGLPGGDEGESRLVAATVDGIRIVDLYCPQGQTEDSPKFAFKLRFYAALQSWLAEHLDPASPWIVLGDLNIAPNEDDVWSPEAFENVPTFHPKEHEAWARLCALGLVDVVRPHLTTGRHFSFWDYRGAAFRFNQGMRIDHILVTEPVRARVRSGWIDRDFRKKRDGSKASDHAPVGIELE